MENIKKQIEAIVTYKSSDLETLKNEYQEFGDRINEGLAKMKDASVFSDAEIKEISDYARQLLTNRFDIAKRAIVDRLRKDFEF